MEFQIKIENLSKKIESLKNNENITEEGTKNALVMPFISILGYDVFELTEVIPEFTADIGDKNGEKVDYAIMKNNEPIILIECKPLNEKLNNHKSQLLRYFHTTKTRIGILTNGINYWFYSDLDDKNVMDDTPFLEIDIENITTNSIKTLEQFKKENFYINNIIDNANKLKYSKKIQKTLEKEFKEPSKDFKRVLLKQVYNKPITENVINEFSETIKHGILQIIQNNILESEIKNNLMGSNITLTNKSRIVTTDDELRGYYIICSILGNKIDVNRIYEKDKISYFTILLDNNNRQPICKLHFNIKNKYQIELFYGNNVSKKIKINDIKEIYKYSNDIINTVSLYKK